MDIFDLINIIMKLLLDNPVLMGLAFSIIRNMGGYFTAWLQQKGNVSYDKYRLGETITLYETFFITLGEVAAVPIQWVAIVTVLVDVLRSIKKAYGVNGATTK